MRLKEGEEITKSLAKMLDNGGNNGYIQGLKSNHAVSDFHIPACLINQFLSCFTDWNRGHGSGYRKPPTNVSEVKDYKFDKIK